MLAAWVLPLILGYIWWRHDVEKAARQRAQAEEAARQERRARLGHLGE